MVDYAYLKKKNVANNRSSAFLTDTVDVQLLCNNPSVLFLTFLHFFCFQAGKRVGKALHAPLTKLLDQEESLGKKRQKVGFFG